MFDEREDGGRMLIRLTTEGNLWESGAVFAVMQKMDDHVMNAAEALAESGSIVVIYVMTDENMEPYVRRARSRLKIIPVTVDSQPEEWL